MRSRSRKCAPGERASPTPVFGKRVSPSAVTAPVIPISSSTASAEAESHAAEPWPRRRTAGPPEAHQAVRAMAPRRRKVLSRCAAIHQARAIDWFPATSSSSTSPAPTPASVSIRTIESTAPVRTGWPGPKRRNASTSMATTARSATPLVARWVNSMRVSAVGERGIATPLQRGQCAPQPAPDPVARTKAPQSTTSTV